VADYSADPSMAFTDGPGGRGNKFPGHFTDPTLLPDERTQGGTSGLRPFPDGGQVQTYCTHDKTFFSPSFGMAWSRTRFGVTWMVPRRVPSS